MRGALFLALVLSGCVADDVGGCDPDEARRVAYTVEGEPAFVGQALMISSCGGGGYCHSPAAEGTARNGVPVGLDYDVRLASSTDAAMPTETERLHAMQARVLRDRGTIWDQVRRGNMPIEGDAAADVEEGAPIYELRDLRTGDRRPLPGLDVEEGRQALRNWLACDAPVVERTEPVSLDAEPMDVVGFVVESQEEPLEPRWDDIYPRYVARRCASGECHVAPDPAREIEPAAGLDLSSAELALAALLDGAASEDEECAGEGPLLTAGEPESSLLFHKLRGTDEAGERVCGTRMPQSGGGLSTRSLEAIEAWIAAGAMP